MSKEAAEHTRSVLAPAPPTFGEVLRARAGRQPDRVAYRYLPGSGGSGETISHARLLERARAVAARLGEEAEPGAPVLLLYPPGIDYIVGLFGCFLAGVVAVPAYPPRHDRQLARLFGIVADCGARIALTTDEWLALVSQGGDAALALRWIGTDRLLPTDADGGARIAPPTDAPALLQYTSGSTATPRGVVLSHANLLANCAAMRDAAGAGPDSVGVSWLPPYHDMGLIGGILAPLFVGFPATLLSPEAFLQKPARWLQAITRYGGTVSGGPNFAYELCARRVTREERRALDLSSWTTAFCGAERVRGATLERFATVFADCGFARVASKPCYGLAEATLCVSFARPDAALRDAEDEEGRRFVSCGAPVEGTVVRAVDPETRTPLPAGQTGELWVAGPGVAGGYFGRPDDSRETFAARLADGSPGTWLRTGDLGFLTAGGVEGRPGGGEVVVTGRIKDLIVVRGQNVYPEDIEQSVERAHPAIRPGGGAAFAVDVGGEERLVVVQEVRPEGRDEPGAVVRAVREIIAREHELEVHAVALVTPRGVPKTTSGKVRRQACKAAWQARELSLVAEDVLERDTDVGPGEEGRPRTELEVLVTRTMAALLDLDEVGVHEDFFALGGQSLLATRLVARLSEQLGRVVPLRFAFEARTAAELAVRLRDLPAAGPAPAPPTPLGPDEAAPLSYSQERMWFLHRLAPESSAYNVGGALSLAGALDRDALRRALDAVVERHAVLRTSFPLVGAGPRPVVRPSPDLPFAIVDLAGTDDPAAEAEARASRALAEPFSLDGEPLIRAWLYRLEAERHVLAVSLHHTVADGWSLAILLDELSALYGAFVAGAPSPLPAPALQYTDYAAWQRRWLSGARLEAQLAYWRAHLAGAPALLPLPIDHPRPARPSNQGALVPVDLPPELLAGLRALGQRHDATLFMVVLAGFQALLARYTRQHDVVVGTPIANRTHTASEGLIGTLVNTLVMRTDLSGDPTFVELLARVRETALGAYANQDLPFEQLVDALAPARTTRHAPIFQVMLDFQRVPLPEGRVAGLQFEPFWVERGGAQFDLSVYVLDTGREHLVSAEYATDLFERDTIERLLTHLVSCLQSAVAAPERRLSEIPLLSPAERAETVEAGAGVSLVREEDALIVPAFARQAAARSAHLAVRGADEALTYAALDRRSNQLARRLRALGAGRGERVAVCLDRGAELVVALLAVLKSGAAYVPLDPGYPRRRLAVILADAAPRVIVTASGRVGSLPVPDGCARLLVDVERSALAALGEAPLPERPAADDLAYVIFTSGSTGRPKGVQVHHGALANFLVSMRSRPGFHARDRLLAVTTVSFDISALELFLPVVAGGSVDVVERGVAVDGRRLRRLLEERAPTVMQATPATWKMLVEAGWEGDGRLKVLCGGEALPRELANALLERAGAVWNLYGPTETTIWSSVYRVRPGEGSVPIGRPIANTRFYVLDERGEPVPRGVAGELFIGGDGVAMGYLGRPELTAERFLRDPFVGGGGARMYRTGDAARMAHDGRFEFLGRLDSQVKLRGFRVELGEIEATLARHPAVREAVVVVRDDLPSGATLVAYVVWRERGRGDDASPAVGSDALREFAAERLPDYMVPRFVVSLPALPLTPNKKVDRKALPPPDRRPDWSRHVVPPSDGIERRLLAIWQEVLGRHDVGVTEDFFDLGGHSLLAVRLFTLIVEHLGIDLPLAVLFEAPTVRRLAAVVRTHGPARPVDSARLAATVVAIRRGGDWPPIFWLHTIGGGGGGGLFRYRRLSELLGEDQPSFGLREPDDPCRDIESLAAAHVAALRTVQRRGPYLLAGFCFGGSLAYEVARQLEAAGEEVPFLALIDSFPPNVDWTRSSGVGYAARLAANVPGMVRSLLEGGPELRRTFARRQLRRARWRLDRLRGRPDGERLSLTLDEVMDLSRYPAPFRDIARLHWRAMMDYHPGPYGGEVLLFRPARRHGLPEDPDRGWGRLARVTVVEIPGTHGDLLEESQVHDLADALRPRLAAALGRAPGSPPTAGTERPRP